MKAITQRTPFNTHMKGNHRKRTVRTVSNVYPPQLDPSYVDPDFFQTYVSAVCQSSYDIHACIRNMEVPVPEVQLSIMNTIRNISKEDNIHEILGPIMVLLIKGRLEDVVELVNLYQMYQGIHASIGQIVMSTLNDAHALEPISTLDV